MSAAAAAASSPANVRTSTPALKTFPSARMISARGGEASTAAIASSSASNTAAPNRLSGGGVEDQLGDVAVAFQSDRWHAWHCCIPTDDLVEHVVALPGREVALLAPRDGEALLSEEAFEHEEFLPYWAELWPSAMALARAIARRPLTGRRVIELGCGLGLPAIAAALAGGRVLATDWSPDSVEITRATRSATARRSTPPSTAGTRPREPLGPPWPLVLASDVLYEARNVPELLDLLPRLTAASGEVWLADPGRAPAAGFLEDAAATWRIDAIPHDGPAHVAIHRLRPAVHFVLTHLSECDLHAIVLAQRSRNALSRSSERLASRSALRPRARARPCGPGSRRAASTR